MNTADKVRQAGVVGAGGGGFPAHVKLAARADTLIANGAECEPLLHKDAVLMEEEAAALVKGMQLAAEAVGAKNVVIGIKAKKKHAVEAATAACRGTKVRIHLLGDYYPAGDEYDLVYEVTGRLIPPAGIPINVGVVVNNIETFINIAHAAAGKPVTHKMLTIAGAVKSPVTLRVPIGTSYRDAIAAAGGLTTNDPVLCIGGLMMGQHTDNLDTPITKTATGVVILPRDHHVMERNSSRTRSRPGSASPRATNAVTAPNIARAFCSVIRSSRTPSCAASRSPLPARIIGTSSPRSAARAGFARFTPARRNCIRRKPATIPRPGCASNK